MLSLLVSASARRLHQAWRRWGKVVHALKAKALREEYAARDHQTRQFALASRQLISLLALLTQCASRAKHMAWRTCGVHLLVGDGATVTPFPGWTTQLPTSGEAGTRPPYHATRHL